MKALFVALRLLIVAGCAPSTVTMDRAIGYRADWDLAPSRFDLAGDQHADLGGVLRVA
jgi:hypothetical protein